MITTDTTVFTWTQILPVQSQQQPTSVLGLDQLDQLESGKSSFQTLLVLFLQLKTTQVRGILLFTVSVTRFQ